jgi:hypothetical protein
MQNKQDHGGACRATDLKDRLGKAHIGCWFAIDLQYLVSGPHALPLSGATCNRGDHGQFVILYGNQSPDSLEGAFNIAKS